MVGRHIQGGIPGWYTQGVHTGKHTRVVYPGCTREAYPGGIPRVYKGSGRHGRTEPVQPMAGRTLLWEAGGLFAPHSPLRSWAGVSRSGAKPSQNGQEARYREAVRTRTVRTGIARSNLAFSPARSWPAFSHRGGSGPWAQARAQARTRKEGSRYRLPSRACRCAREAGSRVRGRREDSAQRSRAIGPGPVLTRVLSNLYVLSCARARARGRRKTYQTSHFCAQKRKSAVLHLIIPGFEPRAPSARTPMELMQPSRMYKVGYTQGVPRVV